MLTPNHSTRRTRGGVSAGCRYARRGGDGRRGNRVRGPSGCPPSLVSLSPSSTLLAYRQPADTPPRVRGVVGVGLTSGDNGSSDGMLTPGHSTRHTRGGVSASCRYARRGGDARRGNRVRGPSGCPPSLVSLSPLVHSPRLTTARGYTTASTWGCRGRPNEWRQGWQRWYALILTIQPNVLAAVYLRAVDRRGEGAMEGEETA